MESGSSLYWRPLCWLRAAPLERTNLFHYRPAEPQVGVLVGQKGATNFVHILLIELRVRGEAGWFWLGAASVGPASQLALIGPIQLEPIHLNRAADWRALKVEADWSKAGGGGGALSQRSVRLERFPFV